MNRRSFFCRFLAVGLVPLMANSGLREIERLNADSRWIKCRMRDLRRGHIFRCKDEPGTILEVTHDPSMTFNGKQLTWSVTCAVPIFKIPDAWKV